MNKHYYSVFTNEQILLQAIKELHIKENFELDLTFNKGIFYKGMERPLKCCDINPLYDFVEKRDYKNTGLCSESFKSIVVDLPFIWNAQYSKKTSYSGKTATRYSSYLNNTELEQDYIALLKECHRLLKLKGHLIFKCQDITTASKFWNNSFFVQKIATELGFFVKDKAILTKPKMYRSDYQQRHFRKTHTYFFILRKDK